MTAFDQVQRHGFAHDAEADESDIIHLGSFLICRNEELYLLLAARDAKDERQEAEKPKLGLFLSSIAWRFSASPYRR
jgi:hypothetical protein